MRDINRISQFLFQIEKIWKQNPDLRFGQIISNVLGITGNHCEIDPFYLEENQFLNLINKHFNYE